MGPDADTTFQALKTTISQVPSLALPDFSKPFVVETDASRVGIGAVLLQHERPLAFFSQALPPSARRKSIYERELMAIVCLIQKWRHYLLGRKFLSFVLTKVVSNSSFNEKLASNTRSGSTNYWAMISILNINLVLPTR